MSFDSSEMGSKGYFETRLGIVKVVVGLGREKEWKVKHDFGISNLTPSGCFIINLPCHSLIRARKPKLISTLFALQLKVSTPTPTFFLSVITSINTEGVDLYIV